jgi:hypothetical protein
MKTALIVVTAAECTLLITVLALYLLSIGAVLRDVNDALQQVAVLLGAPPERPRIEQERTVEAVEHGPTREVSSGGA